MLHILAPIRPAPVRPVTRLSRLLADICVAVGLAVLVWNSAVTLQVFHTPYASLNPPLWAQVARIVLSPADPRTPTEWTRADLTGLDVSLLWPLAMLVEWLCMSGALLSMRRRHYIRGAFGVCFFTWIGVYLVLLVGGLVWGTLPPVVLVVIVLAGDLPIVGCGWRFIFHEPRAVPPPLVCMRPKL